MFKKRANKQLQVLNIDQEPQNKKEVQSKKTQQKLKQGQDEQIQQRSGVKKQKLDLSKGVINSSTTQQKQQKQIQLHKQFKSLSYSAGPQQLSVPISSLSQELLLQQQLAKQKYLQNIKATLKVKSGELDTSLYHGKNNYANYSLTENQLTNAQEKFRQRQGPSRVNSTIRNTCRFDYNFGLCKDWHDSGYCPFGDSCLYLHDRSNYQTGWEQEKDFQKMEKQRWRRIANPQLAAKQDLQQTLKTIEKYKVNQICPKCNQQFKHPVQVDCGHIYCSSCSLKLSKCISCKKSLSGIMNNAQKKMQKMKENYQEMKQKLLKQNQQSKVKRKRHENLNSQDVFAD